MDISQNYFLPKTTVNTIVSNYTKKGYIELIHQEGKKEKLIRLTPEGRNFVSFVVRKMYAIEDKLFEKYDSTESPQFLEELAHMAEHFQRQIQNL